MGSMFKNTIIPSIAIIGWFALMFLSFWWFEYRHWQSFADTNVIFNGHILEKLFERMPNKLSGKVTVVHFTDEKCACSSYSFSHIEDLKSALSEAEHFTMSSLNSLTKGIFIPATPSVAVWDKQGQLAYFGPYSSGIVCGEGEDFVSRVMDQLNQKKNPKWINMVGIGCYCPWSKVEMYND
jgi:hypothetical protein